VAPRRRLAHRRPGPEETVAKVEKPVAGEPWHAVSDVSRPTFTVYPPKEANTGAAVVVFPGGGYRVLAIDLEGTEVCDWLTARGITCVLLKYRVPSSGPHWDPACRCHRTPGAAMIPKKGDHDERLHVPGASREPRPDVA
jgi:acetyl esterase/lipase